MLTHNTVLFDMDGTLMNSLEDVTACVNYMCRTLGLPERTPDCVAAGMGSGVMHLVESSLPEGCGILAEDAVKVYREYYDKHYIDNSKPYDGIIDLLSALKRAGVKTAVISNKTHIYTEKSAEKLFSGLIDVCVGAIPGEPLKPDPAPVKKALERLGSCAENAVYVGDTEVDIKTAENAGIACITCAWGLRGREFLLQNGADPDFLADMPLDVLRILNG